MNRNQLILLLVVLAVIGGAGLVLLKRNQDSWAVPGAKMGDKVLPKFQPNDVAAIHIKGASELTVARKNDVWRVQERADYPANFGQISDLLIKLRDLKVVEAETVDASELGRVNLDEPGQGSESGTLVEFKDAQGKVLASLLAGKKHAKEKAPAKAFIAGDSFDGRYILLPNDPRDVLLISDELASLEPRPQQWLSRDFFKPDKVQSVALASTNAAGSWKVERETDASPWVLVDKKTDEMLDARKTSSLSGLLQFPSFADVAPGAAPAETGLDKPMVVSIGTFDHFTYTLKIGAKRPDQNYYMTVAVAADIPAEGAKSDKESQDKTKKLKDKLAREQSLAQWVYVVRPWVSTLLRDRAQLLAGRKDDHEPGPAR